jgi:RimJ/RimL family protein N-acetyltransferase
VEEKTTNQFVGCVGLWQSPGWPEVELGYWLMKEHQGKGYAFEGCIRSIEFAQQTLRAKSLVSYIDPTNKLSIGVATCLGATYDGIIDACELWPTLRVQVFLKCLLNRNKGSIECHRIMR